MTIPDGHCRLRPATLALPAAGAVLLACGVLLLCSFVPPAFAATQQHKPYALIFGTVFAPDGRVVYGIPVKVRRADSRKTMQDGVSDHQGEFAFRVPPGPADYVVWADVKRKKHKRKNGDKDAPKPAPGTASGAPQAAGSMEVKVHVDGDERVDIGIHLPQMPDSY